MAAIYGPLYQKLNDWVLQSGDPAELAQFGVQAAQLGGGDKRGNVLFTGYFSPVIELRHTPDPEFHFPVYGMPACDAECPTRAQIYDGALVARGWSWALRPIVSTHLLWKCRAAVLSILAMTTRWNTLPTPARTTRLMSASAVF